MVKVFMLENIQCKLLRNDCQRSELLGTSESTETSFPELWTGEKMFMDK